MVRFSGSPFPPSVGKGDLNGDGLTDLVVRKGSNWQHDLWYMDGAAGRTSLATLSPTPGSALQLSGVADFNADGNQDLVFWNSTSGAVEFWLMNGAATRPGSPVPLTGALPLPVSWQLSATGDFNYDGKPDIVWRNSTSQKIVIWTMNGTAKLGSILPTPDQAVDANWEIVGAPDVDNNGTTDFLWYNPNSGNIVQWLMGFDVVRETGRFTNPANAGDNNWKVLAVGDFGAGTGDMVWRNTTSGRFVVWYMDFAGNRTAGVFTNPMEPSPDPTNWTIVGPR